MGPIVKTDIIRKFGGSIIGYIESDSRGNQTCREFGGRILGTYDKDLNVTRSFGGAKVAQGNIVSVFLYPYIR